MAHQVEFPKTHNFEELLDLVAAVDAALSDSLRDAALLTPYGVEARYPSEAFEPTAAEARRAIFIAERVKARAVVDDELLLLTGGVLPLHGCRVTDADRDPSFRPWANYGEWIRVN